MTTDSIYAYQNLSHETVMASESNLNFNGTWSSSGTYFAESKDVVEYGPALYLALVDNENANPTQVPRRGQQAKWSSLVLIVQGTHTDDHTVDEAFAKADQALGQANAAYTIAVDGTNAATGANALAAAALLTAWNGTNGVDQAIQIAVNGTNAAQAGIATVSSAASAAQATADTAVSNAAAAQSSADAAQSTANTAVSNAATAQAAANAAQSTADGAQSSANSAQSSANGARTVADAAFSIAVSGTSSSNANAHERVGFSFVIDGGGAVITSGAKGNVEIPFAMWLNQWTLIADQSGSLVVDVTKSNGYAGYPTVSSIADADRPTISNAQKNQNTNPSSWVRQLNAGDLVGFVVVGAGTVQNATVALSGTRS